MTAGNRGRSRDRAVTECLSPSANTACVDGSRLPVVHRGRPGGHDNLHMSFCHLFSGSKQIVIKADRTRPVTQQRRLAKKSSVVKYNSDLLEKLPH